MPPARPRTWLRCRARRARGRDGGEAPPGSAARPRGRRSRRGGPARPSSPRRAPARTGLSPGAACGDSLYDNRPRAAKKARCRERGRVAALDGGVALRLHGRMLVKMRREAPADEIATVEKKLHDLGFKTGRMEGTEITMIGVYGDINTLPKGEIEELPGVEQLIPISRAYKRAAQKGAADRPIYQPVRIGRLVCGGDGLVFISGPCSVESESQIMEAARMVKEAGADALRGGVRSEERRVGKECRSRWSPSHVKRKNGTKQRKKT